MKKCDKIHEFLSWLMTAVIIIGGVIICICIVNGFETVPSSTEEPIVDFSSDQYQTEKDMFGYLVENAADIWTIRCEGDSYAISLRNGEEHRVEYGNMNCSQGLKISHFIEEMALNKQEVITINYSKDQIVFDCGSHGSITFRNFSFPPRTVEWVNYSDLLEGRGFPISNDCTGFKDDEPKNEYVRILTKYSMVPYVESRATGEHYMLFDGDLSSKLSEKEYAEAAAYLAAFDLS